MSNNLKTMYDNIGGQIAIIFNGIDVAKVEIKVCQIKNCDNPAVERFREISEVPNMCEKHFEIFAKELGQID